MVNPGAFRGTRRSFLVEQKHGYAAAVSGAYAGDFVADIQRRYFKRYPVDLDHNTEPAPEHLAAVDDNAADPEVPSPDQDAMPEDEYLKAKQSFDSRRKVIEFRKEVGAFLVTCLSGVERITFLFC